MKRLALLLFLTFFSTLVSAGETIAEGRWSKIDFEVSGAWSISREDDKLIVTLSDDFVTKNGPDLYVLLSTKPLTQVSNGNANGTSIQVGMLKTTDTSLLFKKMKGAQRFELPAVTDLSQFKSILIHCVEYSHLWAGADLPPLAMR